MMDERRGHKRKAYEDRKDLAGEHRLSDIGQIILLILFITGLLIDKLVLHFSVFSTRFFPFYLRILFALPFFILSFLFARSGLKTVFGKQRKELVVIKSGVFAIVRHPIYLGTILLYFGVIILSLSIISFCIWIVIILFYYFISQYEEKLLIDKLGSQYQEYMDEVPMFVPRFYKKKRYK